MRKRKLTETESAVPVNCMGGSSSTQGTGGIDTFDPLLSPRKKKSPKRLRDILRVDK